jgi:hypothetical protein
MSGETTMSRVHSHTEIRVFETPAHLREIADRMETLWREALPGDDLTAHVWPGDGLELVLVIDQGLMPPRERARGSRGK